MLAKPSAPNASYLADPVMAVQPIITKPVEKVRTGDDYTPPSRRLFLREAAVFANFLSGRSAVQPLAAQYAVTCDQRPIMLVPGFLSDPMAMIMLRRVLAATGYPVIDWGLGRNMGARADTLERMAHSLQQFADAQSGPVTMIGWSLGGLYSRELAKLHPHMIREVITLGTPFSGCPRANNAWRIYERVTGHPVDNPPIKAVREEKPPVQTTAFWSPYDGVVSIGSARGLPHERDAAIELDCGHLSFSSKPSALKAILRHLEAGAA